MPGACGVRIKGRRPGTTPACIADWWRDGTAAIEEKHRQISPQIGNEQYARYCRWMEKGPEKCGGICTISSQILSGPMLSHTTSGLPQRTTGRSMGNCGNVLRSGAANCPHHLTRAIGRERA
jgi:hypothetical protein